jgi:hypothetical protein
MIKKSAVVVIVMSAIAVLAWFSVRGWMRFEIWILPVVAFLFLPLSVALWAVVRCPEVARYCAAVLVTFAILVAIPLYLGFENWFVGWIGWAELEPNTESATLFKAVLLLFLMFHPILLPVVYIGFFLALCGAVYEAQYRKRLAK